MDESTSNPNYPWGWSLLALGIAGVSAIINIVLLILYEVSGGDMMNQSLEELMVALELAGDGFMIPLPVMTWIFLVLPTCLIAAVVTLVAFSKKGAAERGMKLTRSLVVIVIAAGVQPAVFFYTITFHAR